MYLIKVEIGGYSSQRGPTYLFPFLGSINSLILKKALKTFWPQIVAHSFSYFSLLARVAFWKCNSVFTGLAGWINTDGVFSLLVEGWWAWLWVHSSFQVLCDGKRRPKQTERDQRPPSPTYFSYFLTYKMLSHSWSSDKMPQTFWASRVHVFLCILLLWVTKIDTARWRETRSWGIFICLC